MTPAARHPFVVAIYPNSRGVAFVVFEPGRSLIDWGTKKPNKMRSTDHYLAAITDLFQLYSPATLILQDMSGAGTVRAERMRALNVAIAQRAKDLDVPVHLYSRAEVLEVFAPYGLRTKAQIADAIGKHINALKRYVPPPRKPWMSEHAWMGLFDAAALALTFQGMDRVD